MRRQVRGCVFFKHPAQIFVDLRVYLCFIRSIWHSSPHVTSCSRQSGPSTLHASGLKKYNFFGTNAHSEVFVPKKSQNWRKK